MHIFILPDWGRTDPRCPHGLGERDDSGSIFVRTIWNPENRLSFSISYRYRQRKTVGVALA